MTRQPTDGSSLAQRLRRAGVRRDPAEGISDRVGELYVMLTWRCTLRCRMCPMWGARGFCHRDGPGEERLTLDGVLAFADGARRRGLRTVTLSGGEPLLSPLCLPLARALDERGLRVALTTNATGLADLGGAEIRAFHQINLSLDGPAHVLEALRRGGESTLRQALGGLRRVVEARRDGRPRIRLLSVITPEGVGHLDALVARLISAGVPPDDVLFQHALFCDEAAAAGQRRALTQLLGPGVRIWDALVDEAPDVDRQRLRDDLASARGRVGSSTVTPDLAHDALGRFYTDPAWVPRWLRDGCAAPWLDVGVTPAGDVWLCPGHPIGSLDDGFDAVFDGPPARALRRRIADRGTFPACRACFYGWNYR